MSKFVSIFLLCVGLLVSGQVYAINVCTETNAALTDVVGTPGVIEHTTDITAALQECITNAGTTVDWGGSVGEITYDEAFIPRGTYYISSMLTVPNAAGFTIRGSGVVGRTEMYAAPAWRRLYTQLRATTDIEGEPMMEIQGSNVKIQDLIFHGVALDNTTKASVGILVTKGTGIGTGSENFERVHFYDFSQFGIQFGEAGLNNCDLTVCDQCEFTNCTTGAIAIINTQSMGHHIVDCRVFGSTGAAIYLSGGGKTTVTNLLCNAPGITALKGVYLEDAMGPNNADMYFCNLMIDNGCGNGFKLVDSTCSHLDVTFNGGVHSDDGGTYTGNLVAVQGASIVRFNGFRSNFNGMSSATSDGKTPRFIFNDCLCFGGVSPRKKITGDFIARQQGCFAWDSTFSTLLDLPEKVISESVVDASNTANAIVTAGHGEKVYGQTQSIAVDMQAVLEKYGKTLGDITEAKVVLKTGVGVADASALYNKNSTDNSEVTYSMEEVTTVDGSTENHLIVRAEIDAADFGSSLLTSNIIYYIGCSLEFSGETGTFESDVVTNGRVRYVLQRVD